MRFTTVISEDVISNKRILLTGARSIFALDLARRFREKGYTIYTADSMQFYVARYSKSVKKSIHTPSSRFNSQEFIQSIAAFAQKEKIDLVIPTFEEIFCLSQGVHQFPPECKVFCSSYETLDMLHNKWRFNLRLKEMGIKAPKSCLIKSPEDLKSLSIAPPFILKPCYSRASQRIIKVHSREMLDGLVIDPLNPWVAQEWLKGDKFCTYSICHEGKLTAHAVYPTQFCIEDHSCLNFVAIEHPKIYKWVKEFALKENFTGQIAFDFIELEDGTLHAIECNPRGTSGIHLFQSSDNLPKAFFNKASATIFPKTGFSKQITIAMLLFGWKKELSRKNLKGFFKQLFHVPDVVFCRKDLKPFLSQAFLFFTYFIKCIKLRKNLPSMYTYDIDWNGNELAQFTPLFARNPKSQ